MINIESVNCWQRSLACYYLTVAAYRDRPIVRYSGVDLCGFRPILFTFFFYMPSNGCRYGFLFVVLCHRLWRPDVLRCGLHPSRLAG